MSTNKDDQALPGHNLMTDSGVLSIKGFDLPLSDLLDSETRIAIQRHTRRNEHALQHSFFGARDQKEHIAGLRAYLDTHFMPELLEGFRERYAVAIEPQTIGGVQTDLISPLGDGVGHGVLINFHGGGFLVGARSAGILESIAIADLARISVVSVDYRMAPEHTYPAATEDALAVYNAILEEHESAEVGVFGCSAGATLTTQLMARVSARNLPAPAAIGLFFAGGGFWDDGDTGQIGAALSGLPIRASTEHPYLATADPGDPMAFPIRSDGTLARFPPSLLISGTRDHCLSSVVHMHSRLRALGRLSDLLVWEGLGHAFFYDPFISQTHEAYRAIAVHFRSRLSV